MQADRELKLVGTLKPCDGSTDARGQIIWEIPNFLNLEQYFCYSPVFDLIGNKWQLRVTLYFNDDEASPRVNLFNRGNRAQYVSWLCSGVDEDGVDNSFTCGYVTPELISAGDDCGDCTQRRKNLHLVNNTLRMRLIIERANDTPQLAQQFSSSLDSGEFRLAD